MTDLKSLNSGDQIDGLSVLVEKRSVATTKNGKAYLNLTVRDKTRSLPGKLWEYIPDFHDAVVREGKVVKFRGHLETYNGAAQLNIQEVAESDAPVSDFAKSSKFDTELLWSELVRIVGTFQEPLTKFVTEEILLKHVNVIEAFKRAPAAKTVHNAWYGGLLEHVHSLCMIGEPVIQHYQARYAPKLSRDKVLFGLIMHDAGKIVEYDSSKPSFNYTGVGVLTNHIVIGPAWVFETANKFPDKGANFKMERAHLMHILAAHHGRTEWGSPVVPASLEALLVHHLDNLDSKFMHAHELITEKPGEIPGFSERSYFERTPYLRFEE